MTNNEPTKFTALGLSGSGKTCYVLGLYAQMSIGVNQFNITTENDIARNLENRMDSLCDQTKERIDRFPVGTSLNDCTDYRFKLHYQNAPIISVSWMDYAGGLLHDKGEKSEGYEKLSKSIEESTALYIFIDGEKLCKQTFEEKKYEIGWHCSSKINPFITEFANTHEVLPPIIFVITKMDLCRPFFKGGNEEVMRVIGECFSSVWGDKTENVYITATTLGNNIADNNYHGKAEPNMHIPFFIGLYHEYSKIVQILKKSQEFLGLGKIWLSKKDNDLIAKIKNDNGNIKELTDYESKLKAVSNELMRNSNKFTTIRNGQVITAPDFN